MMGLQTLRNLAGRMEDFFKGFKTQQQHLVEPLLEGLLLATVEHMRQVITLNSEGADADEQWLNCVVNPVFDHLQKFDGSTTTPESPLVLPENEQEIVRMIFETEVEGRLQHLSSVLADQDNSDFLLDESIAAAQELGGLGQMLEQTRFSSFCESINQKLSANPKQVKEIATLALREWRRYQAALLAGQADTQFQFDADELAMLLLTIEHNGVTTNPDILAAPSSTLMSKLPTSGGVKGAAKMSEFFLGVNARTSPNDMQSPGSETIYLYDSSELNRECLTSLEHKLDHEDIVCIPTEQLQQINIMFGELSEQHQRTALYLGQLGSLLSKLNHDAHLQLTNDKVPIEFSNGVGGHEARGGTRETRGQGDKETRRQGDNKEIKGISVNSFFLPPSPCPLVPLSPCPLVPLSPCLPCPPAPRPLPPASS